MISTIKLNRIFEGVSTPKENEHCVYCLFDENDICTYVGSTKSLENRIYDHFRDGKDFIKFSFEICDPDKATVLEANTIVKMQPTLNRTLPKNSSFVSTVKLREDIVKLLNENEDKLKIVFRGGEMRKQRERKYMPIKEYNRIIGVISTFLGE